MLKVFKISVLETLLFLVILSTLNKKSESYSFKKLNCLKKNDMIEIKLCKAKLFLYSLTSTCVLFKNTLLNHLFICFLNVCYRKCN